MAGQYSCFTTQKIRTGEFYSTIPAVRGSFYLFFQVDSSYCVLVARLVCLNIGLDIATMCSLLRSSCLQAIGSPNDSNLTGARSLVITRNMSGNHLCVPAAYATLQQCLNQNQLIHHICKSLQAAIYHRFCTWPSSKIFAILNGTIEMSLLARIGGSLLRCPDDDLSLVFAL